MADHEVAALEVGLVGDPDAIVERVLVTVDYSRKTLGLEPGPELRAPFVR